MYKPHRNRLNFIFKWFHYFLISWIAVAIWPVSEPSSSSTRSPTGAMRRSQSDSKLSRFEIVNFTTWVYSCIMYIFYFGYFITFAIEWWKCFFFQIITYNIMLGQPGQDWEAQQREPHLGDGGHQVCWPYPVGTNKCHIMVLMYLYGTEWLGRSYKRIGFTTVCPRERGFNSPFNHTC